MGVLGDNGGIIYVNPREISKATGNKRRNIIRIKEETGRDIKVCPDERLRKREVRYDCC